MEAISTVTAKAWNYLTTMRIADIVDILIVAFLIYKAIGFVRKTNSYNLAKGLILILIMLGLSDILKLTMINSLLRKAVELGLIALLILFQPELRRILERMGSSFSSGKPVSESVMESAIAQTVLACTEMSRSRTGALIVFEQKMQLDDMVRSGTVLDASVSSELLKNIFFVKAPMHDGAVIVRQGRVLAAGCMLPLSKNVNLSRDLGMRHRAGIGMSENSDAVVIIVSEETGSISVAIGGMLRRHLMPETLENILRNELMPQDESGQSEKRRFLARLFAFRKEEGGNEQ